MTKRRVLPQNQESMLEWLEQRRIALIAAYRAVLLADGPSMTAAQLDEAVERWTEFAIGRSTYRERRRLASWSRAGAAEAAGARSVVPARRALARPAAQESQEEPIDSYRIG